MPYCISNPRTGHAVSLGKGAHADNARVIWGNRRGSILGRELNICFIKDQQASIRYGLDHALNLGCFVIGSHRVVGVGYVNQLCASLLSLGD